MRSVNFNSEEGSAILEFIGFGLLLQIPLVVFALNLVALQHDQLAAEAITRDALRAFVLFDRDPSESALELAAEYRVSPSRIKITMTCKPVDCQPEGTWIHARTQIGSASAIGVVQK